jgi:hypothetical protein
MKRAICLSAAVSSALTLLAVWTVGQARTVAVPKLENARVRVVETTSAPCAVRERGVRAHDQVIVFLDDCRYERTDPATGEKTVRERRSGDAIWHDKGEDAPQLVNVGARPYRTIVIELK